MESRVRLPRFKVRVLTGSLMCLFAVASPLAQQPAPAANQLPVPAANWRGSGSVSDPTVNGNSMRITQQSARAVLNWQSFDIGSQAWVHFDHLQGAGAATLNRIAAGADPSQIFGRLTANGQVYLYNRNGIVFGNGAQVNVGSLVASTLNISDEMFERQLSTISGVTPVFAWDGSAEGFQRSLVRIDEGALIQSSDGGRVLVFAPRVVNSGDIRTPGGQAVLAAGGKVYLAASGSAELRGLLVEVDPFTGVDATGTQVTLTGEAVNSALGRITAERGNVSMVAYAVNQSGRVSATTSVNQNGSIRLLARDTAERDDSVTDTVVPIGTRGGELVLGEGSLTQVLPDTSDTKTIQDLQTFNASNIEMTGRRIHVRRNAQVLAPAGNLSLRAQAGEVIFQPLSPDPVPDVRILLEPGSILDVSGLRGVEIPVERNIISVELRGNELRDAPVQRDNFLRNKTIKVDIRKGTRLADISGQVAQIGRGIAEKSTTAGSITLRSEGNVVQLQGATIDVSGGSIEYLDGLVNTTKLVYSGQIVDIADADPDVRYEAFANIFTRSYRRWGLSEVFAATGDVGSFEPGYLEGKDAGTVRVEAPAAVLQGRIVGGTENGIRQRELNQRALAGRFILGNAAGAEFGGDFKTPDIVLHNKTGQGLQGFTLDAALDSDLARQVTLSLERLSADGMQRIALYSEGRVRIEAGNDVTLAPGGSLTVTGRQIDVGSSITVPAGEIVLSTRANLNSGTADAAQHALVVAGGVRLDASGLWTNDNPQLATYDGGALIATRGGRVSLESVADLVLEPGSVIDVSGGGWVDGGGKLRAGTGGSIALGTGRFGLGDGDPQTSRLQLGAELRGYSLGSGGALSIRTSAIRLGGEAPTGANTLHLEADFLQRGGFTRFNLTGEDGFAVPDGVGITAVNEAWIVNPDFVERTTGERLSSFAQRSRLPIHQRRAVSASFTAGGSQFGSLRIGEGARVQVDPRGEIALKAGNQLTVLGEVTAPGGVVRLSSDSPGETDSYLPGRSIWLGADALLSTRGEWLTQPNDNGLRLGQVLDGGTVTIDSGRGYVVAEAGSVIDVSGTSALLDLPTEEGGQSVLRERRVDSHGGNVRISAREGLLFDGEFRAAAGSGAARGGRLAMTLGINQGRFGFPSGDRVLQVGEFDARVPAGLRPGENLDAVIPNGFGWLDTRALARAGFDDLELRVFNLAGSGDAPARVEFTDGSVTAMAPNVIALRRGVSIDTPVLAAADDAWAQIEAGYVNLMNADINNQREQVATEGSGKLSVRADLIDLTGSVTTRGLGHMDLASSGNVRLRGVRDRDPLETDPEAGRHLLGGLYTGAARLDISGARIHATTLSEYTLALRGRAGSTLSFTRPALAPVPVPLSAGGRITARAPVIEQGGVLMAPFGSIELSATERLTLEPGSITSVSAAGAVIPFGRTELTGRDWVYALSSRVNLLWDAPPERRIALLGPDVNVAPAGAAKDSAGNPHIWADAVVDLSGGGDLAAYEFLPGPGGSVDVLSAAQAPDTYAILPSLDSRYGPHDTEYFTSSSVPEFGRGVYLEAQPGIGLVAGHYTLLPARYGLLDGAFLVTLQPGTQDMLAGEVRTSPGRGTVVAGRAAALTHGGGWLTDSRTAGYLVRPGSAARARSEYLDTRASTFFGSVTADAGSLSLLASRSLDLDGAFRTLGAELAPGRRGRAARVDLSADRIAVIGEGSSKAGLENFVTLSVTELTNLRAGSLLVGGVRSGAAGDVTVQVAASEVVVANAAGDPLSVPELLLAARESVTVRSGAVIEAKGGEGGVLRTGDAALAGSGDGALLAVSGSAGLSLRRQGVSRVTGTLRLEDGASVRGQSVTAEGTRTAELDGDILLEGRGALRMGADRIAIGAVPAGTEGLSLSNATLQRYNNLRELTLLSYSDVGFYGVAALGSDQLESLTIEAGGITGHTVPNPSQTGDPPIPAQASVRARRIVLTNVNGSTVSGIPAPQGALQLNAGHVDLGVDQEGSTFVLGGFSSQNLRANSIVAAGRGALRAEGNLVLATDLLSADTGARYRIDTAGNLETQRASSVNVAYDDTAQGGALTLSGRTMRHGTRLAAAGGSLSLEARAGTLELLDGSSIEAASALLMHDGVMSGTRAGEARLIAHDGDVTVASGASIDLRGRGGGDAGELFVSAADGKVRLDGALRAWADVTEDPLARHGSAEIDTGSFSTGGFSALNARLNLAGASQRRVVRLRTGDIDVAGEDLLLQTPGDVVAAHDVVLSADDGNVNVAGVIDARGPRGGRVTLAARRTSIDSEARGSVVIADGARLDLSSTATADSVVDAQGRVSGTRGRGGELLLSSSGALLPGDVGIQVHAGAVIDVSGAGPAANGRITLRAPRTGITVPADAGTGVRVASSMAQVRSNTAGRAAVLEVEAVKQYEQSTADAALLAQVVTDNNLFVAKQAGALPPGFVLRPGVEIISTADLTLSQDWDLAAARHAGQPGVMTLRAAGNLVLNASLSDGFADAGVTAVLSTGDSWAYRLVSGADPGAADPLTVIAGSGDLTLGAGQRIRTGTGAVDIAAGGGMRLTDQASVIYTAGQKSQALPGFTVPRGRVDFPVDGGDIRIRVTGDIDTPGSRQVINDWLYRQGNLGTVARSIQITDFRSPAWWLNFPEFQQGIGTLGGGDLTVNAGGSVRNLALVAPTVGRLPGTFTGGTDPTDLVVTGGGDVTLRAGGDIGSALVYVERGVGRISAGGDIGSTRRSGDTPLYSILALGDANARVHGGGDVTLDAVFNPFVIAQAAGNVSSDQKRFSFFTTQGGAASLLLNAGGGDLVLRNSSGVGVLGDAYPVLKARIESDVVGLALYPATLRAAARKDVVVENGFTMMPSGNGALSLLAGENVAVNGTIYVSDVALAALPSPMQPDPESTSRIVTLLFGGGFESAQFHDAALPRLTSTLPARVVAINGDVTGPAIDSRPLANLPTSVRISAGRDVRNPFVIAQNLRPGDITRIEAGRDLRFDLRRNVNGAQQENFGAVDLAGQGRLEMLAGRNVDLGNARGLITRGNANNPYLPEVGADILVRTAASKGDYAAFLQEYLFSKPVGTSEYDALLIDYMARRGFPALSAADARNLLASGLSAQTREFAHQVLYAELRAAGRFAAEEGQELKNYERGFKAVKRLLPPKTAQGADIDYSGDLNLFFSQIKTEQKGDIDIMVPGGLVNAGLANPGGTSKKASELGILTIRGGTIRSYVRDDFLVNQSRVFTLQGGDILLWSNEGNIDAGKGAKTASATPPPRIVIRNDKIVLDTSNSVAGSGISVLLGGDDVTPGTVELYAPRGIINAGDAGIFSAGDFIFASKGFEGADNAGAGGAIKGNNAAAFAPPAVAPVTPTGAGDAATSAAQQAAAASAAESAARQGSQSADAFRPSFITVELLGFGEDERRAQ